MQQKEAPKKGFFDRLPKFSKASVLILMVGIFLVILIALILVANKGRDEYPALQQELTNLQKIASVSMMQKGEIENKISAAQSGYNSIKGQFPTATESNRVVDDLLKLADANGVEITSVSVASGDQTVAGIKYPALTYTLNLLGEASRMQTFIHGLKNMGACQITSISIKPSGSEDVMDTGTVKLNMLLR